MTETPRIGGIHHVTAIAGDAQENLDFYAGTLGLRLVKRSVNQDDPARYHLFFADAEGQPGTDLTFFPWGQARRGDTGAGMTNEVAFAIPPGSLSWWRERLEEAGVDVTKARDRFGDAAITFTDPHGLDLALVATEDAHEKDHAPWERSPVPPEHQLRGFHAVRVLEHDAAPTARVATELLGMEPVGEDDGWTRYQGTDPTSGYLELRADPDAPRARQGVGTVHHVAWRAGDADDEARLREAAIEHGLRPTEVIDRFWFESVYFREPGGVLFELATEAPGFTADEPLETLGERLVLPPWLESDREKIERLLPSLELPYPTADASATAAESAPARDSDTAGGHDAPDA